jgi:hypothetical protein
MSVEPEILERVPPKEVREAKAVHDRYQRAIRQLDKHVSKGREGRFELKVKNSKEAEIDEDLFQELKGSLELANEYLGKGIIPPEQVVVAEADPQCDLVHGNEWGAEHRSTANHTHWHWWGVSVWANERTTHDLVDILGKAAGSAAVAGAVTAYFGVSTAVAALIAGAIFLLASLLFMVCSWGAHKGLYINVTWAGFAYVWHQ